MACARTPSQRSGKRLRRRMTLPGSALMGSSPRPSCASRPLYAGGRTVQRSSSNIGMGGVATLGSVSARTSSHFV